MNRRILIQVTAPTVVIGLLLFGACLVSAWYINRLQANMSTILSKNVASLRAAQQLEISLRQLRFHCFLHLIDPDEALLKEISLDHQNFEEWLERAKQAAHTAEEEALIRSIEEGYDRYHAGQRDQEALSRLRAEVEQAGPQRDYSKLAEAHPIRHVVDPCRELLRLNEDAMEKTSQETERISQMLRLAMVLLGLVGPISGLVIGYGIARGLSRSIYELSVHVQDITQRLDQDVGSVSMSRNGDIQGLDKQLQQVVQRVTVVVQRLQSQQREMIRAQQLSAVGQLAASVAHEVRNPLTGVKMLVESALRSQNRKPLTMDDLRVIHGEIVRLEQTVQDFLDFSRLPKPQRSPCDLREVVSQAVELIRARARQQKVEVEIRNSVKSLSAHVDRGQLCTVLVNLLINALDAMPSGGRLQIDVTGSTEGEAQFVVTDTGEGIPPEMVDCLFTPFTSTKETGTGLGLTISQRIVEEHGGRITVANRPEGGARFTVILPTTGDEVSHANALGH